MSRAALRAEGLTVTLGGTAILRDVSIEVAPGEILGVLGPSGAGKSTLFRALTGEERLTSGKVSLADRDVTAWPLWRRARAGLGYLPQTPSVLLDLTAAENLAVFASLAPPPPEGARRPDVRALLADLGLEARAGVRAGSLSGGERRRLELGRALTACPRVLLCDEPFAAIDPAGKGKIAARLRALAREGTAVILADHHVTEALGLCDRAALLLAGELVLAASPREFCADPRVREHYVAIDLPQKD